MNALIMLCLLCNLGQHSAIRYEEMTWQALNVADALQTLDIKHHPAIHEGTFRDTMGCADFIGAHPSDAAVIGLLSLEGYGHYLVSKELASHNAPRWLQQSWQMLTLSAKASVVDKNYRLGLRFSF